MRSHQNEKQKGNNPEYKMKVEKVFKDSLSRQVGEAVMLGIVEGQITPFLFFFFMYHCINNHKNRSKIWIPEIQRSIYYKNKTLMFKR